MTRTDIAHVLCPVDFSDIAQHAVDHSAAIAGWYEARLTLLHVVEMPSALAEEPTAGELDLARIRDAAAAKERQVDLIVMGVHGRSALDVMVLGSTTHHVIRSSACLVLIVPATLQ